MGLPNIARDVRCFAKELYDEDLKSNAPKKFSDVSYLSVYNRKFVSEYLIKHGMQSMLGLFQLAINVLTQIEHAMGYNTNASERDELDQLFKKLSIALLTSQNNTTFETDIIQITLRNTEPIFIKLQIYYDKENDKITKL